MAGLSRRTALRAASVAGLAGLFAACGASGSTSEPPLSPAAAQGRQLAISSGCASCHNFSGQRAAGPTWKALYGTEVELADGTTVLADEAYLRRSIMDPASQKVKGFGTIMPKNKLTEEQVTLIIAYIEAIGPS